MMIPRAQNPGARCLVLGGTGALGSAVVRMLARRGAILAFTYFQAADAARALAAEAAPDRAFPMDLASVRAVDDVLDRAAQALGGLDVLIHCAGVAVTVRSTDPRPPQRIETIDEDAWDTMLDVNLKGSFFACRGAARIMQGGGGGGPKEGGAGGGEIVLVGSVDAVKPLPSAVHFVSAKAALGGMARALAKELGPSGIRINVVAPGIMDAGVSRTLRESILAEYLKHCGLKRLATPVEVAEVIGWLALENTYISGQTLVLDGAL